MCLDLKPSKDARWSRRLTVARSRRTRGGRWWVGRGRFGIGLGYEDLTDHETLRHDPLMAVLAGKLKARRPDCAAVAGKSTLNRLELSKPEPSRYHKISYDAAAGRWQ